MDEGEQAQRLGLAKARLHVPVARLDERLGRVRAAVELEVELADPLLCVPRGQVGGGRELGQDRTAHGCARPYCQQLVPGLGVEAVKEGVRVGELEARQAERVLHAADALEHVRQGSTAAVAVAVVRGAPPCVSQTKRPPSRAGLQRTQ